MNQSMQLGLIGLGTMGANLARNAARNGAQVAIFNRTSEKTDAFMAAHGSEGNFIACKTPEDLLKALQPPRAILIMVKAGQAVDDVIAELTSNAQAAQQSLATGDILIDAGNSNFTDSQRREQELLAKGIRFLGIGVSGGEEGALNGPSMMVGGNREAFDALQPLLTAMAASDGGKGKCVAYMGPGGAGHFVKMVHNGIEYGDMQLIAEAYHLLRSVCGFQNAQLATLFTAWNAKRDLQSYLMEITATIFSTKDPDTGMDLIDLIRDAAQQKGTGKWTTQAALDLGVAIPTITAAVDARILSAMKTQRVEAAKKVEGKLKTRTPALREKQIAAALLLSKICSYAQGIQMIATASSVHQWNIPLGDVCRIWKGGCIIRSALLSVFQAALKRNAQLQNVLMDDLVLKRFTSKHNAWRRVVAAGAVAGVPLPAMSASLSYFDAICTAQLPQNLTQAQRDFFGAHTYERTDRDGTFHTAW